MAASPTWTAPADWANGELVTDTKLNQQVRDNLQYLWQKGVQHGTSFPVSPITHEWFYRTDKNLLFRYSGTAWEIMAGVIAARYKAPPSQNVSNGTITIVNFATADFDTHSRVTTGASWKFTAEFAATYRVTAFTLFVSRTWTSGQVGMLLLYKNNAAIAYLHRRDDLAGTIYVNLYGTTTVNLAIGDYIDVRVYQESSGALALHADPTLNYINIEAI